MSAVWSAAAVALLVQCAPKKDKETEAANKSSALIEGMDFSALEKSENSPSTKALLQMLKENKSPNNQVLATALIELHVKSEAKSDEKVSEITSKTDAILEKAMKIAEGIKATKPEELKKVKSVLSEKRAIRKNSASITIQSALENGEFQEYSGTSLLTLLWLKTTPPLDSSKGAIFIEDKSLKLAELRADKKIFSIDSLVSGQTAKDEGTTDELVKSAGKKKIVALDLFVIHEAFKPFAADAKAWALRIQKASNARFGLQIAEKDLTTNSSVDKSKLNQSEILIGTQGDANPEEMKNESETTPEAAPNAENKEGKGASTDAKAGGTGDKTSDKSGTKEDSKAGGTTNATSQTASTGATAADPAGSTAGAADKSVEKDSKQTESSDKKPGYATLQNECISVETLLNERVKKAAANSLLSMFGQMSQQNEGEKFLQSPKAFLVMSRAEALEASAIASRSAELGKLITEAQDEAKKKNEHMILFVKLKNNAPVAYLLTFLNENNKYVDVFQKKIVTLDAATLSYLKSKAGSSDLAKDTHLLVEMKTENNCLK
jgi:hypothetical protein